MGALRPGRPTLVRREVWAVTAENGVSGSGLSMMELICGTKPPTSRTVLLRSSAEALRYSFWFDECARVAGDYLYMWPAQNEWMQRE
jgi:hypothetical protein